LISEEIDVPVDAEPFSVTPIIGGSARLQLQAPVVRPGQATPMLAKDGTARITGPIRGGLLDAISKQLDARMEPINRALENFNTLSATYTDLGRNLNDLLATQSPEVIAGGAPPNIKTAVTKLNSALDDIHAALDLAKDWLGDEQIRADARTSVEKARTLIENATAAVEKYATLAESLQSDSQQMVHKLLPLADQLAATLEDVNRLTHAASRGEGTVGQLMTNPDLYNSLNDAALRLERTLVEVQLLIQKFKKEGVPINW
jgi:ABC-type transporter Mla subunit MlaD